jgi:hypothetical protein
VVVYQHGSDIWSNRYDATSNSWGTPGSIDARGAQTAEPAIAVDQNGNYLIVWGIPNDATLTGIWQSTSSDGVHWSAPAAITTTSAFSPALSMNAPGAAIVAWTESNGSAYQAAASIRAATGATWSAPQVLRPGDDYGDRNPAVAMSGTGQAFVAWEQSDGGAADYNSVWLRQYTAAGGWTAAGLFESYNAQAAYAISMWANTAGAAIVTYVEVAASGATVQIWSRRYDPATGFGAPLEVAEGNDIETTVAPSVTLDESGVATVAWGFQIQSDFEVYTNRAGPTDAAWPTPMAMETDDLAQDNDPNSTLGAVTMPTVRNDPAGNVTLIWRKRTSGTRFDLAARRFAAGAWGAATLIETLDTDSVSWPRLGVGVGGTAVATWYYENAQDVWANVFH